MHHALQIIAKHYTSWRYSACKEIPQKPAPSRHGGVVLADQKRPRVITPWLYLSLDLPAEILECRSFESTRLCRCSEYQ